MPDDFRSHFWMKRETVEVIVHLLAEYDDLPNCKFSWVTATHIELWKQMLLTFWVLAEYDDLPIVSFHGWRQPIELWKQMLLTVWVLIL